MTNDVACACFDAPSEAPTCVNTCEEDLEPGDEERCGKLLVSTYGTRPAAQNWQRCYTKLLTDNGFTVTRASSCIMIHKQQEIELIVHGDDFVPVGTGEDLEWLKKMFETRFAIQIAVLGPEQGDAKEANILNRNIMVNESGYIYEVDARHSELIAKNWGLREAKGTSSPTSDVNNESDEPIDQGKFKRFPSLCARGNFLATDSKTCSTTQRSSAEQCASPRTGIGPS